MAPIVDLSFWTKLRAAQRVLHPIPRLTPVWLHLLPCRRQLVGRAWELLQQNSSYVDRAKRDYIRLLQVDMCREAEDDKQVLDTLKLVCKK